MLAFNGQQCDEYGAPVAFDQEVSTGTTIMACEFDGGVVIGADSRTSTGSYIANRVSDKLTRITDYIYCCRSGSAADTQAVADIVAYHLDFYRAETGEEPTVETAAAMFRDLCYKYREQLVAGIIVAGWDKIKGGQVYTIPLGGMCKRQELALGGSGSTFIYGYADSNFKKNMTETQCKEFIKNAIALAINRDGSSGGVIRVGVIRGPQEPSAGSGRGGITRETITGSAIPEPILV